MAARYDLRRLAVETLDTQAEGRMPQLPDIFIERDKLKQRVNSQEA